MEITNYESDGKAGIQTIPVKYWTVMVANVALGWSLLSGVAVGGSLCSAFARGIPLLKLLVHRGWDNSIMMSTPLLIIQKLVALLMTTAIIRRLVLSVVGGAMLLYRAYSVVKTRAEDLLLLSDLLLKLLPQWHHCYQQYY